jgi:hypothetical protein
MCGFQLTPLPPSLEREGETALPRNWFASHRVLFTVSAFFES